MAMLAGREPGQCPELPAAGGMGSCRAWSIPDPSCTFPAGWNLGTEIVLELLNIHMFGMKALAVLISKLSSSRCLVP